MIHDQHDAAPHASELSELIRGVGVAVEVHAAWSDTATRAQPQRLVGNPGGIHRAANTSDNRGVSIRGCNTDETQASSVRRHHD